MKKVLVVLFVYYYNTMFRQILQYTHLTNLTNDLEKFCLFLTNIIWILFVVRHVYRGFDKREEAFC